MNIDCNGNLYGYWKMYDDTFIITNRWQNLIYLIEGKDKALLIDTGYGDGNLREIVEKITDKPIMVANTHGHFDHTGGNGLWQDIWMAKEAFETADTAFTAAQEKSRLQKPYVNYNKHILQDNMIIDLGERSVEAISIGAHSDCSIAFLDSKRRLLFCGDEIESGQVLLFNKGRNKSLKELALMHKSNMQKLQSRLNDFDFLCPSHNGTHLLAKDYIEDFIALDDIIISGDYNKNNNTSGFGFPPDVSVSETFKSFAPLFRLEHNLASFVCQNDE